jgi:hypothetical protein
MKVVMKVWPYHLDRRNKKHIQNFGKKVLEMRKLARPGKSWDLINLKNNDSCRTLDYSRPLCLQSCHYITLSFIILRYLGLMIFAKNMLTQVNSGQYYFPSGSLLLN